jgi:signal peptidase I
MTRLIRLRSQLRRRWLAAIMALATVIAAVVALASPFMVDGISMSSTVQSGQVVLVDRVSTALGLQRGEVIVFHPPGNASSVSYIKRVIGLAGDHVSITDGFVFVNGQQLNEPYVAPNTVTLTKVWDFETTVPAGSVFVLGDDRWESWDSRYFGPVPDANIIGRAWLVLNPGFSFTAL